MRDEFDPYSAIAKSNFSKINEWLCAKIWRHGMLDSPTELFESICGKLDPSIYADYLEKKFNQIYDI